MTPIPEKWRDHSIDAAECRIPANPEILILVAFIPVSPQSVRVSVTGPMKAEAEIRKDFSHIVRSLRGKTNWKTPWQRSLALVALVPAILGILMFIAYGFGHALYFRHHDLDLIPLMVSWLSVITLLLVVAFIADLLYLMNKGIVIKHPDSTATIVRLGLSAWPAVIVNNILTRKKYAMRAAPVPADPSPAPPPG